MTASHVCVEDKNQYTGGVEVVSENVLVETLDGRTYTMQKYLIMIRILIFV